jgi:hypothetical protein
LIRTRAERRLGEMMVVQKSRFGTAQGRRNDLGFEKTQVVVPTLAEAGIDKSLADRTRKLNAVPQAKFDLIMGTVS